MIVHPELCRFDVFQRELVTRLVVLPAIYFDGYHPDLCYIRQPEGFLTGPLHDYHSSIAFAAFLCGCGPQEAAKFYKTEVYRRCGYFNSWTGAKTALISDFASLGYDLTDHIVRWSLDGPFMHSVNHPRINVIYDLARMFVESMELKAHPPYLLPADNLANGPLFPVYPELGEAMGVEGSYLFKPLGLYRYLSLEEFLSGCFESYARFSNSDLNFHGDKARLNRAIEVIKEVR